jgi:hypothetical protein
MKQVASRTSNHTNYSETSQGSGDRTALISSLKIEATIPPNCSFYFNGVHAYMSQRTELFNYDTCNFKCGVLYTPQ